MSADIMNGYTDRTVKPDQFINRAESAKIIQKTFSLKNTQTRFFDFTDVSQTDWFHEAVAALFEQGLISGYADHSFGPGNFLTRAESAKILALAIKSESEIISNFQKWQNLHPTYTYALFRDVPVMSWYAPYVYSLASEEIVKGKNPYIFTPEEKISRGELAVMTMRIIEKAHLQYPNS